MFGFCIVNTKQKKCRLKVVKYKCDFHVKPGCIDTRFLFLCRSTESATSGLHESLGGVLQETRWVQRLHEIQTTFECDSTVG